MKIAIINKHDHKWSSGGMGHYSRLLIKALSDNNEVLHFHATEVSLDAKPLNTKIKSTHLKNPRKNIEHWLRNNTFDIIINNNPISSKKILNDNRVIFVQHADLAEYWENCAWGYKFASLFSRQRTTGNPLKKAVNVIYFSKFHFPNNSINKNMFEVQLPTEYIPTRISKRNKRNLLFLATTINKRKGYERMIDTFSNNNFKSKVNIVGMGNKFNIVKNALGEKVEYGFLSKEEMMDRFDKSVLSMSFAKWEGFPFAIIEGISRGVPVVSHELNHGFESFFNDCPGYFSVKQGETQKFIKTIREIENMNVSEYNSLSLKTFNWAKDKFGYHIFEDKIINIINKIYKERKMDDHEKTNN